MAAALSISVGQYSSPGAKKTNQDFYGVSIPAPPLLLTKGIAVALADGISSSSVSHIASEASVRGFLADYFCTSEAWTVKKSAHQVLAATNSWLYAQSRKSQFRFDLNKGYVCTFSALIFKSTTAHLFHVGDSRIYRLSDDQLEQLTEDHRHWINQQDNYLSRAMGIKPDLEIDYQSLPLHQGDYFILATDGVYEFIDQETMTGLIERHQDSLDDAAKHIVDHALTQGSDDNLTIQIIRIDALPDPSSDELYHHMTALPFPPILQARQTFDGYRIIRTLHASSRSHVYLAIDLQTQSQVVIKTPSIDLRDDPAYLERFLMEEWIARRIDSPHVLKPYPPTRERHYLYLVMEYIDGQTLTQWMRDHPKPELSQVRNVIEQIARGLMAFHRLEMIHQDLRPENIMVDTTGTVKIIDFGATKVAGIAEIASPLARLERLGTAQYAAPEYFLGEVGQPQSDLYSLAVITYQMLTGHFPYGTAMAKATSKTEQHRLRYRSALLKDRELPAWVDETLKKALHPNPYKRYPALSEFLFDLSHPNPAFIHKTAPPLLERDPVLFWKGLSLVLALIILALLAQHH